MIDRMKRRIRHEIRLVFRSIAAQPPRTILQRLFRFCSYLLVLLLFVLSVLWLVTTEWMVAATGGPLRVEADTPGVTVVVSTRYPKPLSVKYQLSNRCWAMRTFEVIRFPGGVDVFWRHEVGVAACAALAVITFLSSLGTIAELRCWRCNYDLRGHPSARCPECGAGRVQPNVLPLRTMLLRVRGWYDRRRA